MTEDTDIDLILEKVWDWSEARSFRGYNKHDGLNSPVLRSMLGWAKWPRIAAIQAVMRFPVNIRPLMLIPETYNPKGLALFSLGCLDRYKATEEDRHLKRAERLLDLLVKIQSPGKWSGICWGYHYPWQDPGFFAPANTPNAVVTAFVCEAFLEAYRITGIGTYLDVVESAGKFFLNDLTVLLNEPDRLCLAYMPVPMTMRVMDVSILIGAVLAQLASMRRVADEVNASAGRLVNYVSDLQTDYGAWFYTDPPDDSLIRHDNYHTGFILDALWRYMEAADDWSMKSRYEQGLKFYAEKLFNADGSPRWMSDRDYPHDVHGAAQGILTFSNAARRGYPYADLTGKIYKWSIDNLYSGDGRFFYQKNRYWTKTFTLLRWCNAWMFRGLSSLSEPVIQNKSPVEGAGFH